MVYSPASEVEKLSGVEQQVAPEELQLVDGEPQTITQAPMPLIEVTEPEKRVEPLPVTAVPTAEAVIPATTLSTGVILVGQPVAQVNRYSGAHTDWVELIRWDIPVGYIGDLHEFSLLSDNDTKTRYRVWLANINQEWPTDRLTTTPLTLPFRNTKIPGGTSVYIEILSTDGTSIIIEASLSGTVRLPE